MAMIGMAQKVKRVFHSTVRVGLAMTRRFGLTPSRYELMMAIKSERQIWYSQRLLRDLLGIAASTLSRMVDALVSCGFLRRQRDPEDGRRNLLRLTLIGKRALAYTFRTYVKSGLADYVFGRGMTDGLEGGIGTEKERTDALYDGEAILHTIHLNFGKEAYFDYAGRRQPSPVGIIPSDPDFVLWENDEPPILKFLAAATGAVESKRAEMSAARER
jgi:DNA-binding MarR family transcriptional regulator